MGYKYPLIYILPMSGILITSQSIWNKSYKFIVRGLVNERIFSFVLFKKDLFQQSIDFVIAMYISIVKQIEYNWRVPSFVRAFVCFHSSNMYRVSHN
jgi:hypothetical protein